jgi:hypothetical protein
VPMNLSGQAQGPLLAPSPGAVGPGPPRQVPLPLAPPTTSANTALGLADDLAGPAAQSAPKEDKAEPVPVTGHLIQYNGDTATPVTGAAAQANAGQGRIVIDTDTGRLVSSGNMPPGLALGLLNRWKAKKPLGQEF